MAGQGTAPPNASEATGPVLLESLDLRDRAVVTAWDQALDIVLEAHRLSHPIHDAATSAMLRRRNELADIFDLPRRFR